MYLNNNYMTGAVLKDMPNNSGNFTDGAASEQYQLTSTRSSVTISKDGMVNLYALLLNKSLTTGSTAKVLLRPDEYVVTFDDTKVQVTADSSGIYVKALTDIPQNTNFSITIQIRDNTGSEYSQGKADPHYRCYQRWRRRYRRRWRRHTCNAQGRTQAVY